MSGSAKIRSKKDLRERYGEPFAIAVKCKLPALDRHHRTIIAHSPFLCLASASADGTLSVSPKGDKPGFVEVLDANTLLLPDRPGNNQIQTLENLVENANVSLIFFVPGIEETLRVVGRASIETDPEVLGRFAVHDRAPKSAIRVNVEMATVHCGKAVRRSHLWDPSHFVARDEVPTLGQMVVDQAKPEGVTVETASRMIEEKFARELF
jgi:PPOX class probable FMN-dependent enzyme